MRGNAQPGYHSERSCAHNYRLPFFAPNIGVFRTTVSGLNPRMASRSTRSQPHAGLIAVDRLDAGLFESGAHGRPSRCHSSSETAVGFWHCSRTLAPILSLSALIASRRPSGGLAAHSIASLSLFRFSFIPADSACLRIARAFKIRPSMGLQNRQFRFHRQIPGFEVLRCYKRYFSIG
jgi:hypothetical protein